jgi:hypothetical protein
VSHSPQCEGHQVAALILAPRSLNSGPVTGRAAPVISEMSVDRCLGEGTHFQRDGQSTLTSASSSCPCLHAPSLSTSSHSLQYA